MFCSLQKLQFYALIFILFSQPKTNRKKRWLKYIWEDGGGTVGLGLTPTEEVCWLFEEEMLANISSPTFLKTALTQTKSNQVINFQNQSNEERKRKKKYQFEEDVGEE